MEEEGRVGSAIETLSQQIRQMRQRSGLTLEEISGQIKIKKSHLEKIESGDMTFLPPVYVFAFLKEYASALGIDNEVLIEQCRDEFSIPTEEQVLRQLPKQPDTLSMFIPPQGFKGMLLNLQDALPVQVLIGGGVAFILVILLLLAIFFNRGEESAETPAAVEKTPVERVVEKPAPPAIVDTTPSDMLAAAAVPDESALAVKQQAWAKDISFLPKDPASPLSRVLVVRIVNDLTWVKVIADNGEIVYPGGQFKKDEVLRYEAKKKFWVNIGRPSNVELYVNGERVPSFTKRTIMLDEE